MTVRTLLFTLLLCFPLAVSAQDTGIANTGSFYSSIGFGAPADAYSSYTLGMGLPGVSTYNSFAPSSTNPAQWGWVELTQAQVTMGLTNFEASDNISSAQNSLFGFENFQLVFPLSGRTLGASISFSPVTRADYNRVETGSFQPSNFMDEVEYSSELTGSGGVNRLELGLGYRLNDYLSIGYASSVYLLSLKERDITRFSDNQYNRPAQGSPPIDTENSISGYSFGQRAGLYSRFSEIFSSSDRLQLGASVNLPVSIDADRTIETFRTINNQSQRVEINEGSENRSGNVTFPLEFNTGLTYYLNSVHSFSTELQYQNWEDAEFSYNVRQQGYYKDRTKVGFGYQYHPYTREQRQGFLSNLRYSIGATYDDGFLAIDGQDIETTMLHAGFSIPSQRSRSSVDFSVNYGIRGTDSGNLVKENIWGFKLSFNLAEFMFFQQRFQ